MTHVNNSPDQQRGKVRGKAGEEPAGEEPAGATLSRPFQGDAKPGVVQRGHQGKSVEVRARKRFAAHTNPEVRTSKLTGSVVAQEA